MLKAIFNLSHEQYSVYALFISKKMLKTWFGYGELKCFTYDK